MSENKTVSVSGEPLEIERKYLIGYPSPELLTALGGVKIDIVQTYLTPEGDYERRVRSWSENGVTTYFATSKCRVGEISRIELERVIGEAEYASLLKEAAPGMRPLVKTRWRIPYDGKCVEVDVYPFWNDRAVAEVELSDEAEPVRLPPALTLIREVTPEKWYRNTVLAMISPEEAQKIPIETKL